METFLLQHQFKGNLDVQSAFDFYCEAKLATFRRLEKKRRKRHRRKNMEKIEKTMIVYSSFKINFK